jgi:hypothetical protein
LVRWAPGACLGVSCRTPDRSLSRRPETAPADHPPTAWGGSARKVNRHSDHSSQQERQHESIPCCRTGRKCSFLIRRADRSSFVAVGRFAVFVAWHFLWRGKGSALLPERLRMKCRCVRAGTGQLHDQFGSILCKRSADRSRSVLRVVQVPDAFDQLRLVAHAELPKN